MFNFQWKGAWVHSYISDPSLPPESAVEVIESVPWFRLSGCLSVSQRSHSWMMTVNDTSQAKDYENDAEGGSAGGFSFLLLSYVFTSLS